MFYGKPKNQFFLFLRNYSLEIIVIISFLILLIVVDNKFAISSHLNFFKNNFQNHQKKENSQSKENYFCSKPISIKTITEKTYPHSSIFSYKKYKKEFIKINAKNIHKGKCIPGSFLKIPYYNAEPIINYPLSFHKPIYGLYIRWDLSTTENIIKIVKKIKKSKINSLVIDAKDIVGVLTYRSTDPIVQQYQKQSPIIIKDFNKLVHYLHKNHIYVIVRIALFKDMNLAHQRRDLAIYHPDSKTKTIEYKNRPAWVDPAKKEVQDYNLRIFKELLSFGVDEIQFDYVRYPAEGNLKNVKYHQVNQPSDKIKHLKNFLFQCWLLKYHTRTKLSLAVFGITAWQVKKDIEATGQDIPEISIFLDYISPMLYPSHFNYGFEGISNPADNPEYIYQRGLTLFKKLVPSYVKIRPWIQAFRWRVSQYNEAYILRQIQAIQNNGGYGWLMWNAANHYEIPLKALKKNIDN